MTRITYIHAVPSNEFAQRGQEVTSGGFIPYLSLTAGEMRLMLARQRAKIYAQFYPDFPQYREAVTLIDNALNAGLSNGVNFVGAIPSYLQDVARMVKSASRQTAPASKSGLFLRPDGGVRGIGAIIPYEDRKKACMEAAKKLPTFQQAAAFAKCLNQFNIEKTINDHLERMAHHMLYKSIPKAYAVPTEVAIRRSDHRKGVEGIAGVGKLTDYELVYQWVENGIILRNSQNGVGPIGSEQSSFSLAPNPEEAWAKFKAWSEGSSPDKWRPGAVNGAHIGLAFIPILIDLLKKAIEWAFKFLTDVRKSEIYAMAEARGFGTPEFSANQDQWIPGQENPETTGGLDTTTLLLLAAGAGLLLFASDEK